MAENSKVEWTWSNRNSLSFIKAIISHIGGPNGITNN